MTEENKEAPKVETNAPAPEAKKCPIDLIPMSEWVGKEDPKVCRPCLLGPVVQWYAEELRANGKPSEAAKLEEAATSEEPLTLCKELDNIKNQVEEPLRERLKDFDCAAQSYKEEDDEMTLRGGQTNG